MKTFISRNKNIFILIFWLLIWEILYLLINKDIVIPAPINVFKKLYSLIFEKSFWLSIFYSSLKTLLGFLGALVLGSIFAFLIHYSNLLKLLLTPIFAIIKSTPIVSFILLSLLFIHSSFVPLFIALIMVLPIIFESVYTGIESVDKKYLEMAKIYNYSKLDIFKNIYVKKVLPYFASSSIIGIGFAWKSAVAAELISSVKYSIGNEIYKAKLYLETDTLFAWTIVIILLSILFTKIFTIFMRKFV